MGLLYARDILTIPSPTALLNLMLLICFERRDHKVKVGVKVARAIYIRLTATYNLSATGLATCHANITPSVLRSVMITLCVLFKLRSVSLVGTLDHMLAI